MTFEFTVIERSSLEFIPVVKCNGVEVYRGSIHQNPHHALVSALACDQVERCRDGVRPQDVAL